jgi:hypothetical protein
MAKKDDLYRNYPSGIEAEWNSGDEFDKLLGCVKEETDSELAAHLESTMWECVAEEGARVARPVVTLHHSGLSGRCAECQKEWPCPTVWSIADSLGIAESSLFPYLYPDELSDKDLADIWVNGWDEA